MHDFDLFNVKVRGTKVVQNNLFKITVFKYARDSDINCEAQLAIIAELLE